MAARPQASALPLAFAAPLNSASKAVTTCPPAVIASCPLASSAPTSFGPFVCNVVTSVPMSPVVLPWQSRLTVGGVQLAVASAWLWQLAWQFASAMQLGCVISPSHLGAVAVPMHVPLQLAIAPQVTLALASSLQSPVQLPLQLPLQCAAIPGVYLQAASHWPLQTPEHAAPLVELPSHVPEQLPMHVPLHSTLGRLPGVHVPEQSAEQVPWQVAAADTDPSHVPPAMQAPLH